MRKSNSLSEWKRNGRLDKWVRSGRAWEIAAVGSMEQGRAYSEGQVPNQLDEGSW